MESALRARGDEEPPVASCERCRERIAVRGNGREALRYAPGVSARFEVGHRCSTGTTTWLPSAGHLGQASRPSLSSSIRRRSALSVSLQRPLLVSPTVRIGSFSVVEANVF